MIHVDHICFSRIVVVLMVFDMADNALQNDKKIF